MRTKLKQKKRTKSYSSSTTTTTTKAASKNRTTTASTTRRKPSKRLRKSRKTSAGTSTATGASSTGLAAASNHQANVETTVAVATINHPRQQLFDKETFEKAVLKYQLKKATIKFEKACKQLLLLDQKINDLQNSYTSSMETDRKTFKIVNRMQLATLEGTHEAYIEYIERKVDEIRQLKYKIFGNDNESTTAATTTSSSNTDNNNLGASTSNDTNSRPLI